MIIAIDGPTASGKGSIARRLAAHYGLPHLDTGLLYRAVAWTVIENEGDPDLPGDALDATDFHDSILEDPGLRSEEVGGIASRVSAFPAVREALAVRQRDFATQAGGAVLDGRDIGTVIAPQAELKLFVTASAEARARRRHREMQERGISMTYEAVLNDIRNRDQRDQERAIAPLKPAEDALLLDTTEMTIDAAVQQAIALVDAKMAAGQDNPGPA